MITNIIDDRKFIFRSPARLSVVALETVELPLTVTASFRRMNRRISIDKSGMERGLANGLKQKLQDAADKVYKICISRLCFCCFVTTSLKALNPLFDA